MRWKRTVTPKMSISGAPRFMHKTAICPTVGSFIKSQQCFLKDLMLTCPTIRSLLSKGGCSSSLASAFSLVMSLRAFWFTVISQMLWNSRPWCLIWIWLYLTLCKLCPEVLPFSELYLVSESLQSDVKGTSMRVVCWQCIG